jgi:hypothetical protein
MAVTGYDIQSLRNEVYAGGGPTDMAHYGTIWFGRNNCSLSEFISRSWWKSVYVGFTGGSWVNFNVPDRGGHDVIMFAGTVELVGADEYGNGGYYVFYDGSISFTNTGAWNSFNYVAIAGGGNIPKTSFTWTGSIWTVNIPYPGPTSGATMVYAPT